MEVDRNRVVNEFLPEFVHRLLSSHEFKEALAKPFNLFYQSGLIDGANLGLEPEQAMKVSEEVENLDLDADSKYQPLYDQALTQEYLYVQKIRKTVYRSFNELIEMFPNPAPSVSDATHVKATASRSADGVVGEKSIAENPEVQGGDGQDTSAPV